ncbi:outer membrane beta-barrel protein [Sphingobacterium wenxiniae]|uniref:Outer membrane protein beta-barrel domain-containing protein n=1 Tax=Sphingobacterium wenxiniae TaxID=683125 RepID=A0A1I6R7P5_9SPHI|nr:outer membrane beta-barrel protein [Sphingobacterium wenxiniae]SFS60747.1 Outer membrane protein beta-barrel domain-containing protein [Sphingobacterium wenxiniae]
MKNNLLYTAVAFLAISFSTQQAFAQEDTKRDSSSTKIDTDLTIGRKDYDDRGREIKYPRVFGGLTFTRIDWGFSRIMDDGSFNLGEDNQFLEYKKASNFGFDVAQFGIRFNESIKMYVSAGFEWNYLRLKHNIILDQDATPLAYDESDIAYKKNIFTSTYLRTPLTFEWRGNRNRHGDRPKIAVGAMTGILLKGTQRLKSEEHGKQKFKDNYNLASFQYGAFARVGFGSMGIFAKYYMNDMFEKSPTQEKLNNFTFGMTLGF